MDFVRPSRSVSSLTIFTKSEERAQLVQESLRDFGIKRVFPTKNEHRFRNTFNSLPKQNLLHSGEMEDQPNAFWCIPIRARKVFEDPETHERWQLQPWYLSLFHNPAKNCKLLSMDALYDIRSKGSSEIIIPKKKISKQTVTETATVETIHTETIIEGSYNYRTHGLSHFWADVLPNVFFGPHARQSSFTAL